MKSAALRDAMMVRLKEAATKWPTFADMPEVGKKTAFDIRVAFKADLNPRFPGDMNAKVAYIEALHSMCAVSTPVGRIGNDMVGLTDEAAANGGQQVDDKGVSLDL
jgi:hypothetical protein